MNYINYIYIIIIFISLFLNFRLHQTTKTTTSHSTPKKLLKTTLVSKSFTINCCYYRIWLLVVLWCAYKAFMNDLQLNRFHQWPEYVF